MSIPDGGLFDFDEYFPPQGTDLGVGYNAEIFPDGMTGELNYA
jgi:hypothetical protein